ncbi:uncharacterized protein LOC142339796 [Convolutriloba macropyga]|uniref:uncharacterized protein LOC142339796 n=1 Tax=Convolutriloba macropyga TaxID=536237 RepID=UPI003F528D59
MVRQIDESKFRKKLLDIDDRQDKIQNVAQWILNHSSDVNCAFVTSLWLETFRANLSDRRQLNMLYVANDIIQNGKRNKVPQFVSEFSKILKQAFLVCRNNSLTSNIGHIVDIWDDRGVYKKDFCADLRAIIKYSKPNKDAQSKTKKKSAPKPVMQVKPMPKKQASSPEMTDEWKTTPKDLFELPTTTAVLKKCSKRKHQLEKQHENLSVASNLIDRLTSYGASDETLGQLFSSVDDMKAQIEATKNNMELFVDTLSKKVKYDMYAIKCLSRAEFYFKDQHENRRTLANYVSSSTETPLKLQAWVKARKGMLQSHTLYPVRFNTEDTETTANASNVQSTNVSFAVNEIENISDSSDAVEVDEEYSPPRIDGLCSPPPLSRGIPLADEPSVVDSTVEIKPKKRELKATVELIKDYREPSVNLENPLFMSQQVPVMTPVQQHSNIASLIPGVQQSPILSSTTNSTPSFNLSADSLSPDKKPASNFSTPTTMSPVPGSNSGQQVSPPQSLNPFGMHPMTPFMMAPVGSPVVTQSNTAIPTPPIMPTAPPIPFPPPSNFPPPPFPLPFLPPSPMQPLMPQPLQQQPQPTVATTESIIAVSQPTSTTATTTNNDSITINADVHAALNSLLGSSTSS